MTDLGEVQRVCAHPQALAQCRGWLDEHLPGVERVPVSSNAEGARRARDETGHGRHRRRRRRRGLRPRDPGAPNIEDQRRQHHALPGDRHASSAAQRSRQDHASWCSAPRHANAGALFRLLEPLAKHKVSMTRIESRPSRRRKWDYVFFIDLEGHADDAPVAKALAELQEARFAVPRAGFLSAGHPVTQAERGCRASEPGRGGRARAGALCDRQAHQRTGARTGHRRTTSSSWRPTRIRWARARWHWRPCRRRLPTSGCIRMAMATT